MGDTKASVHSENLRYANICLVLLNDHIYAVLPGSLSATMSCQTDDERIRQIESTLVFASFHGRALDPRFSIQGFGTPSIWKSRQQVKVG